MKGQTEAQGEKEVGSRGKGGPLGTEFHSDGEAPCSTQHVPAPTCEPDPQLPSHHAAQGDRLTVIPRIYIKSYWKLLQGAPRNT